MIEELRAVENTPKEKTFREKFVAGWNKLGSRGFPNIFQASMESSTAALPEPFVEASENSDRDEASPADESTAREPEADAPVDTQRLELAKRAHDFAENAARYLDREEKFQLWSRLEKSGLNPKDTIDTTVDWITKLDEDTERNELNSAQEILGVLLVNEGTVTATWLEDGDVSSDSVVMSKLATLCNTVFKERSSKEPSKPQPFVSISHDGAGNTVTLEVTNVDDEFDVNAFTETISELITFGKEIVETRADYKLFLKLKKAFLGQQSSDETQTSVKPVDQILLKLLEDEKYSGQESALNRAVKAHMNSLATHTISTIDQIFLNPDLDPATTNAAHLIWDSIDPKHEVFSEEKLGDSSETGTRNIRFEFLKEQLRESWKRVNGAGK